MRCVPGELNRGGRATAPATTPTPSSPASSSAAASLTIIASSSSTSSTAIPTSPVAVGLQRNGSEGILVQVSFLSLTTTWLSSLLGTVNGIIWERIKKIVFLVLWVCIHAIFCSNSGQDLAFLELIIVSAKIECLSWNSWTFSVAALGVFLFTQLEQIIAGTSCMPWLRLRFSTCWSVLVIALLIVVLVSRPTMPLSLSLLSLSAVIVTWGLTLANFGGRLNFRSRSCGNDLFWSFNSRWLMNKEVADISALEC